MKHFLLFPLFLTLFLSCYPEPEPMLPADTCEASADLDPVNVTAFSFSADVKFSYLDATTIVAESMHEIVGWSIYNPADCGPDIASAAVTVNRSGIYTLTIQLHESYHTCSEEQRGVNGFWIDVDYRCPLQ